MVHSSQKRPASLSPTFLSPQERTKEHPGEIVIGETVTAWIAGTIRTEPGGVIRVGDSIDIPYSIAHLSALKSDSRPD